MLHTYPWSRPTVLSWLYNTWSIIFPFSSFSPQLQLPITAHMLLTWSFLKLSQRTSRSDSRTKLQRHFRFIYMGVWRWRLKSLYGKVEKYAQRTKIRKENTPLRLKNKKKSIIALSSTREDFHPLPESSK